LGDQGSTQGSTPTTVNYKKEVSQGDERLQRNGKKNGKFASPLISGEHSYQE
ncbi:hypothetical protein OS493_038249, partial [Desmophyllum pertusum]